MNSNNFPLALFAVCFVVVIGVYALISYAKPEPDLSLVVREKDPYDRALSEQLNSLRNGTEEEVIVEASAAAPDVSQSVAVLTRGQFPDDSKPIRGIVWEREPKKIDDLGLVFTRGGDTPPHGGEGYTVPLPTYYLLGTSEEGMEVIGMRFAQLDMAFGPETMLYVLKVGEEQYKLLLTHMGEKGVSRTELNQQWLFTSSSPYAFSELIEFDDESVVAELYPADILVQHDARLHTFTPLHRDPYLPGGDTRINITAIPGTAYHVRANYPSNNEHMQQEYIYTYTVAGLYYAFRPVLDFVKDSMVPSIVWNDGTINTTSYRFDGLGGCGGGGAVAVLRQEPKQGEIVVTGKTSTGEPVYGFTSAQHPVVKSYLQATNGNRFVWDKKTQTGTSVPFTPSEYLQDNGLFLYRDVFSRWVVFSSSKYGPNAECGKPVIYLYPEQRQAISVRVGADLTVVEPEYPRGWDVIAKPSGELTTPLGIYPYLYWEGYGHGTYPAINQGVIVPSRDVERALVAQMTMLGLNKNEQKDFLEFWMPHMPETPYVRLSWLGTKDMDRLAPLTVTPKPDTSIRVFLDFEGIEKPYTIEPQKLTSIPRKGFTLVEWGGLLIR
ncbi:MAG: hypothetical protein RI911_918 [Candidatus Parcubacteria bacterium]|jgi:hypothetical protein